jgi:hypothetical protein
MKTLDLKWNIKDLDGKDIQEAKASELLGVALINDKGGDAVKLFDWAVTLRKEAIIIVDDSDFTKIKDIVENSEQLPIITKAQLLKYFISVK